MGQETRFLQSKVKACQRKSLWVLEESPQCQLHTGTRHAYHGKGWHPAQCQKLYMWWR